MTRKRALCVRVNKPGIFEGFGTIADQILQPSERPKIPIAVKDKYLKIRLKQGLR
jgi:hypothetical protein